MSTKFTSLLADDDTTLTGATLASGDVLCATDVSDTTEAASGTSKAITAGQLAIGLASLGSLATDAELTAHEADTTNVHGIADTSVLATATSLAAAITAHSAATDPHADRAYADTVGNLKLAKASNLSDLQSASTARTNLGLAAIAASGSASDLSAGTVPSARLGTGGAGAGGKVLADNQTFVTLPTGDVAGPASSADYALALFDSTTGKLLKQITGLKSDANGRIFVPDGTSSGYFFGDSNTGWYEAANNQPTLKVGGTDVLDVVDFGGGSHSLRYSGARGILLNGAASSNKRVGDGTAFFTFAGSNGQAWFAEGTGGASHQVALIQGDFTGRSRGIRAYQSVYVRTSDVTLDTTDSASLITNEGASGAVIVTLPSASAGLWVRAVVHAAQNLRLKASTGDTIRIGASVSASAGFIQNSTQGSFIELHCVNATEWIAGPPVGTWTIDS